MQKQAPLKDLPVAISEQLFEIAIQYKIQLPKIIEEFDLPPMQGHLIHRLKPNVFVPMNSLAKMLGCDPSNITGITDRLERRQLIQRKPDPSDRRSTLIGLSPTGIKLRERLLKRLFAPSKALLQLSTSEQAALHALLSKIVD